jgi:hypothetical protein
VNLSTGDQIASIAGGSIALVTAVVAVWMHVKRRRSANAEREGAEVEAFLTKLNEPSPEEIAAKRLRRHNQRTYYDRYVRLPRRGRSQSSLVAVGVLLVITAVVIYLLLL